MEIGRSILALVLFLIQGRAEQFQSSFGILHLVGVAVLGPRAPDPLARDWIGREKMTCHPSSPCNGLEPTYHPG